MDLCARRVLVSGVVQGVGFRYYTRLRASELGLSGWVQNLADGRVEVWVEGPPAAVEQLLEWLRRGPPGAQVSASEAREVPPAGLERFEVRRQA
jgi:acylphosphatase